LQPLGHLVSVFVAPRAIALLGARATIRFAFLVPAVGFLGFGVASSWILGAAMMFVTGLGIGAVEVAVNTLIITRGGERRTSLLNLTHLFFGVASVLVPVAATQAVAAGMSWAMLCLLTATLLVAVGVAWGGLPDDPPAKMAAGSGGAELQWTFLVLLALTLAVYVGAEMGIGSWLTKYMMTVHGASLTVAGNVLSLYWLGLTAGRLGLSLFAHRVRDENLLLALSALATLSVTVAMTAGSATVSAAGFIATGLGFSGIFPGVIAIGGRRHPQAAARATSVLIGGAGIGQITLPWLMSVLADRSGMVFGMALYGLLTAVLVVLSLLIQRRARRNA
jgi:fucose permease